MFSRAIAAGLLAMLPMSVFAADPVMVKSVDVMISLEDLTNAEAATKFVNVEIDLENAIAARLINRIAPEDGVEVTIDISELELSNSFTETFNLADTKLAGIVKVKGTAENPDSDNYELSVDVNSSMPFFPAGTVVETLSVDSDVYYTTLITAFADSVVRKLDE
jgi:hypothetical protein